MKPFPKVSFKGNWLRRRLHPPRAKPPAGSFILYNNRFEECQLYLARDRKITQRRENLVTVSIACVSLYERLNLGPVGFESQRANFSISFRSTRAAVNQLASVCPTKY
uniref:Uncharacterized protein n=1 Tax=Phlegmariurus squarrosus TaxID=73615 RepID=H9M823_PHLSQ|nr:hypothetical protein HusqMp12 [Phlegmariurus squarrosus]AEV55730.1 hypothetical protein HusqMp12 [Phlegmariurus squarrosus]